MIRRTSMFALLGAALLAFSACRSAGYGTPDGCGCPGGTTAMNQLPDDWATDSYVIVDSDLCEGTTFVGTRRRCTGNP